MWCNFRWGKVSGGQLCCNAIVWGAIIQGAIFLEGSCPRTLQATNLFFDIKKRIINIFAASIISAL